MEGEGASEPTYLDKLPELGYNEQQIQEAVDKMSPADKAKFFELKRLLTSIIGGIPGAINVILNWRWS